MAGRARADRIPSLASPKEAELHEAFDGWWTRHVKHITELPDTKRIMEIRADLLDSFVDALEPLGVLDRYQLAGIIASWWGDIQYDVKTLASHGFDGLVQGWLATIEEAFSEEEDDDTRDKQKREAEKRTAREHRLVPSLIPDYLDALEEAEARRAQLDAQVQAMTAKPDDDEDVLGETFDLREVRRLKGALIDSRRQLKNLEKEFLDCLKTAAAKLDANSKRVLVLSVLDADLLDRLDAIVEAGRRGLSDRYRTWANKYWITLANLEFARDAASARINSYLRDLGYE